jgi:hypothetical protein
MHEKRSLKGKALSASSEGGRPQRVKMLGKTQVYEGMCQQRFEARLGESPGFSQGSGGPVR